MLPLDKSTIGGRIRAKRLEKKISIKNLAQIVNISENHLYLVEKGAKSASIYLLERLANTLNTTPDWLINGDPPEPMPNTITEIAEPDATENQEANNTAQLALMTAFSKLNDIGKWEAVRHLQELTFVPMYSISQTSQQTQPLQESQESEVST